MGIGSVYLLHSKLAFAEWGASPLLIVSVVGI
jgi:hypothetical protein